MKKRKIIFISTNRADYNIQKKIIYSLSKNKKNSLILIITGTHLSKKFGYTKSDLDTNKLKTILIKNLVKSDKRENVLDCISEGIKKFKKVIKKISPDIVVLIGDSIITQWYSLLPGIFSEPDWKIIVLTKSSCAMVDEAFYYSFIGSLMIA